MIAEVLSPTTEERDRGFKFRRYAQEGVSEYWLVNPEKELLEIFVLAAGEYGLLGAFGGDEMITSTLLAGLAFPAVEVWK